MATGSAFSPMCGGMNKKRIVLALLALAALGACNTVDGIGRDISSGAQTVQDAF